MREFNESMLVLSPAFVTVALAGLVNDLSVSTATVAVGTTAMLFRAAKGYRK